MTHKYEIVVGNVGRVAEHGNGLVALGEYNAWVRLSKATQGRASGEDVTLLRDGEILKEYHAPEGVMITATIDHL